MAKRRMLVLISALSLTPAFAGGSEAADGLRPGELKVDPPTLHCLGFVWHLEDDANRNAAASVRYRAAGTEAWREAQPLLRVGGHHTGRPGDWHDVATPDYLAGSILGLEPGTEYEVRLTATDPEGVKGEASRIVSCRTRSVPAAAEVVRVYHVYPPPSGRTPAPKGINAPTHPKGVPFIGLYKAYYGGMWNRGDWNVVWPRPVQPGDTIIVHRGIYKADLHHYTDPHALIPDGTYWLTAHGTAEKPIVIKAAGDGEVVFDGAGAGVLFNVAGTKHHIFEDLTFRNCGTAIFAGMIGSGAAEGLTVHNCRFEDVRDGIFCLSNQGRDYYLADNIFLGRNQRETLTFWGDEKDGYFKSNTAITLQGTGHVVCRNGIAFFWQAIHMGTAFQGFERGGVSCDFYHNDLHQLIDDGFEVDGCMRNVRVWENRIVNSGSPISAQPVYGGPAYFVRNVAYNSRLNYKFNQASPSGLLCYHNTFIGGSPPGRGLFANAHFRNNIYIGVGRAAFPSPGNAVTSDYNGYSEHTFAITPFAAASPIIDASVEPPKALRQEPPQSGDKTFATLEDFRKDTDHEQHGRILSTDDFQAMKAAPTAIPETAGWLHTYYASTLDFSLNPTGRAVDVGVVLPNINDGFVGSAPDLGAMEAGSPGPVYGPGTGEFEDELRDVPTATRSESPSL